MIVSKRGFKRKYAYGGTGIFDSIGNILMRLFTSNAAKQLASSALDVGKNVAKNVATDVGTRLVKNALTPKSKKILQKYEAPSTQNISTLIDGSGDAVEINKLVRKLNKGMGIKKT